jgi:hypothetical protein
MPFSHDNSSLARCFSRTKPSIGLGIDNYYSENKVLAKWLGSDAPAKTIGEKSKASRSVFIEVNGMINAAKIGF